MRYQPLGQSGLRVSELCLGAMTFGQQRGSWGADKADSRKVFDAFVEAGGNFFDTANTYQGGESETFLGEFVGAERDHYVIATKFSAGLRAGDPNAWGNGRKNIRQSVEASLRRLGTDYIDLYWMHAWDQATPQEEVLRALDDLVTSGKVLHIGLSDTPAWVIARSQTIAELRGWAPLAAVQLPYSLVERTPERELLPMAERLGLGVTTWGGLGSGILSGKYTAAGNGSGRLHHAEFARPDRISEAKLAVAAQVSDIAEDLGVRPAQVALAWLRQRSSAIVPIIGARTVDQLQENLACLNTTLDPATRQRLDNASAIDMGFPTDFLTGDMYERVFRQSMSTLISPPAAGPRV
ncbi:aldo/keto reductase [Georgenia sp. AZ-5]|uniref:aldo/keto reductase n=1 Tax=Georgenia sp. AZ-5 TaxID=3367526 RepID=UPI0037552EDD